MKKVLSVLLAFALGAVCLAGCGDVSKGNVSQVVICQLVEHPALDEATKGFEDALKKELGSDVIIYTHVADGSSEACSSIIEEAVNNKVDLIMTNATPAMVSAVNITGRIPIVATSITDYGSALNMRNWNGVTGINVTGTSDLAPIEELKEVILEVKPNVERIGIIYSSSESNSQFQANSMKKLLDEDGIKYEEYAVADDEDIKAVAMKAVEECDAIYIPTDNRISAEADSLVDVFNNAKVPMFGGEEGICRAGVATVSIDYYSIGYEAGEMAVDILKNGANPANMEIKYAKEYTKKYNRSNANKIGIAIPQDYVEIQ